MKQEADTEPRGNSRRWPSGRRRLLAAVAVAVLAIAVALVVVFGGGDSSGGDPAATGSATSGASSSSSPSERGGGESARSTTAPLPGTTSVAEPPRSLPQVALDQTASVGDGVTVAVSSVESIQGRGTGPGNVAGPAYRVTLGITNGTAAQLGLDAVTVNMAYGDAVTPMSPLEDPSHVPFSGSVPAGGSAHGVYVFRVPSGSVDPVVIEVGYRPGAPLVIFVGPVD